PVVHSPSGRPHVRHGEGVGGVRRVAVRSRSRWVARLHLVHVAGDAVRVAGDAGERVWWVVGDRSVSPVDSEEIYPHLDVEGVDRNRDGVGPKAGNGNTEVCFEAREASPGGWAQVRLGRIVDVFGDRVPSR